MSAAARKHMAGFEEKKTGGAGGRLTSQGRKQTVPGDERVREYLLSKRKIPLKARKAYDEVLVELERFNDVLTRSGIPIRFKDRIEPDPLARHENESFSYKYKIDEKALPQAYVVFIGLEKEGSNALDWGVKIFITPMQKEDNAPGDFTVRTQDAPDQPEIFQGIKNKEGLMEDVTVCFEKVMSQYAKTMKLSPEETAQKWRLFSVNLKRGRPVQSGDNGTALPKKEHSQLSSIDL